VAHAMVYERHGSGVRPHGPEWRALMRAAGFEPRVRVPDDELKGLAFERGRARARWQHRCPVCHATRVARTSAPRWKCVACVADGLEGRLIVTPIVSASPGTALRTRQNARV
jgi:ribosomal protein L37AE/L43A